MSGNNHARNDARILRILLVFGVVMGLIFCGCDKTPKVYRVGIVADTNTSSTVIDAFKIGMNELSYAEGKNILYDVQRLKIDPAEAQRIVGKFAEDKTDLLFVFYGQMALIMKAADRERKIPIVFAYAALEGTHLINSIRNPGENITGVRIPGPELALKSLESLLEFTPRMKRIMVIFDPQTLTAPTIMETLRRTALYSGVTLLEVHVNRIQDTQAVLQGLEKSGNANMDAIMYLQDSIPRSAEASGLILKFADAHRVPVAGGPATLVRNGGSVLSAATDVLDQAKVAASLADKILKGAPAGTIPVMSTEPHLYINYRKARELGLTVPPGLLKQASEIIR
jgi:putative tryptophan/tyrosine transport system substrate-binding protein